MRLTGKLGYSAVLVLVAVAATIAIVAETGGAAQRVVKAEPLGLQAYGGKSSTKPLPTSSCKAAIGIRCYSPAQFENAYDLAGLARRGHRRQRQDDRDRRLVRLADDRQRPAPVRPDLRGLEPLRRSDRPGDRAGSEPDDHPAGRRSRRRSTRRNGDMVGWAQETTLDVEWAHVIAPKANILLVETPTSETEGVQGFPEIVTAENYVIDHHLASVISQSFGATEETFPNTQSLLDLRSAFKNAQQNDVTVLGASGDEGSTDFELNARRPLPDAGEQLAVERPARDERRRHADEPRRRAATASRRTSSGTTPRSASRRRAAAASARSSTGPTSRTASSRSSATRAARPTSA